MAFILTIHERGNPCAGRSPFSSERATRQSAQSALVEYVNWQAELDEDLPAGDEEMVGRYFDELLESGEITEAA